MTTVEENEISIALNEQGLSKWLLIFKKMNNENFSGTSSRISLFADHWCTHGDPVTSFIESHLTAFQTRFPIAYENYKAIKSALEAR